MLDEVVGPSDADDGDRAADFLKGFEDGGTEAAHLDVILEGDEGCDAASVLSEHVAIDGLDEARIDDCGGEAVATETAGELTCVSDHGTEAKDGDIGAVGEDFGLTDGEVLWLGPGLD